MLRPDLGECRWTGRIDNTDLGHRVMISNAADAPAVLDDWDYEDWA